MSEKVIENELINNKVNKYILISLSIIVIIGILTAIVVFLSMNNKVLKGINDKSSETKEVIVIDNEAITGIDKYGNPVSLEYDSDKKYKIINMSGNYDTFTPDNINISLVFSDDGENWIHLGETEYASKKNIDTKTHFMVQYVDIPFKFATVHVTNLENNTVTSFNCTIKLSN